MHFFISELCTTLLRKRSCCHHGLKQNHHYLLFLFISSKELYLVDLFIEACLKKDIGQEFSFGKVWFKSIEMINGFAKIFYNYNYNCG